MWRVLLVGCLVQGTALLVADQGFSQDSSDIDLTEFSLEELLDVEVVSISRKAQSVKGSAAAVFVISAEDIRRSGVHTIPEALRLAPGLNVARINSSFWAITSRGFNSRFANKLQVLVDGRSIYSPMFSGVYWEDSSVMLEDIERIEIIRGPGATMWGANAVNGVINIITQKPDPQSLESFVALRTGTLDPFRGAGRFDSPTGNRGALRVSAQYQKHGTTVLESGDDSNDAWEEKFARVRWDYQAGNRDFLTVTGHAFQGDMDHDFLSNTENPPYSEVRSGTVDFQTRSLQGIWVREFSQTAGLKLGLYLTHFDRQTYLLAENHHIVDLDFQHNFLLGLNHEVIWGGTCRFYSDKLQGKPSISFSPDNIDGKVYSAFLQDDWTLIQDRLHFILGGKLEYRKDSGDEWQPNFRLAWTPSNETTWWGSVARAVRIPSRINLHVQMDMGAIPPDAMYPGSPVTTISMEGNPEMEPEELLAFETGFRYQPSQSVNFDLALFLNQYDELRILEKGDPTPHPIYGPPIMMIPMVVGNGEGGQTMGGELAANFLVSGGCRFQLAYSYLDFKGEDSQDGRANGMERFSSPRHQVSLRGLFNLSRKLEGDAWLRYVDELMASRDEIPHWAELDLRLAWKPEPRLNLVLGGKNLLHDDHQEFQYQSASPYPARLQRSGYLELQWRF